MKRKFRVKFLFVGGLLFAVLLVSLQVFQPATASHSKSGSVDEPSDISTDKEAAPKIENTVVQSGSTAELKKEIETLTKIQDKLITNYIKLKRERDLAKERIQELQATALAPQGDSAEFDRLVQERDKFRREVELAQVQIEQLSQEKQGKMRISNELEVVNTRTKNLQAEVARLQSERSGLEIELSKSKSELESTRTGRSALLQEVETLRSQVSGDKEKFTKGEAKLKQDLAKQTVEKQKLTEELRASKAEKSALDAAIKSLRDEIAQGKTKLQESVQAADKQKQESVQAADKQKQEAVQIAEKHQQEVKKLNDELAKVKQDSSKLDGNLKAEIEAKKKLETELIDAKSLLAKRSQESDKLITKVKELRGKEGSRESKLGLLQNEVKGQSQYIEQCDAQLSDARAKLIQVTELERQLVQLQNELLLKNTELEIYSSGNQGQSSPRRDVRKVVPPARAQQLAPAPQQAKPAPSQIIPPEIITPSTTPSEMIIEITTAKGQLRAGPGKEQGVVMHVREGTRLVVEDKQGEWYRVLTSTGTRAYGHQDIARVVGQSAGSSAANILENRSPAKQPSSVFETNPDEVDRAMQQLKRGITGR